MKADLPLVPGDTVEVTTTRPGLSGGSCRAVSKVVKSVDEGEDRVLFTDGSTYNHAENPDHTLRRVDLPR